MDGGKQRWHILFSGKVQHVGFRYTAYYLARDLGLTGWVDNLADGRVAASNLELVQNAAEIIRGMGRELATPQYARQLLGVREKESV